MGHSLTLRTSPGRSSSDFRLGVRRCLVSVATWFAGIIFATAATALSRATAASQSDLRPSGAVTTTMFIPSARARRSFCRRLICFLAIEIPISAEGRLEQMTCDQDIQLFRSHKKHRPVRLIVAISVNPGTSVRNLSVLSRKFDDRIIRERAHRSSFQYAERPLWVSKCEIRGASRCFPLCPQHQTLRGAVGTSLLCHVWTAPDWQGLSSRRRLGRCCHVFGL
jgi:hypothetical protein